MSKLCFKEVNEENFDTVIGLTDTLDEVQKQCVAPNVYSIAEATLYPDNVYYRAIYYDNKPVGFFMVFIPDEKSKAKGDKDFFLWRLMLVKAYQHKGLGKKAMDKIVALAKTKGYRKVLLSCDPIEGGPLPFYAAYGFYKNGKMYGDEVGMTYRISDENE